MDRSLNKLPEMVKDREAWRATVMVWQRVRQTRLSDKTTTTPGDLRHPEVELGSPALADGFLITVLTRKLK